jgi:hypothetical protein
MSDIIETLLLRNLQEVFGEGDPAHRRAAISELYTKDCTVLLPMGRYVGGKAPETGLILGPQSSKYRVISIS